MKRHKINNCICGGQATIKRVKSTYCSKKDKYQVVCNSCGKVATPMVVPNFAIVSWNLFHNRDKKSEKSR